MKVTWTELKSFVTSRELSIQWIELFGRYYLLAFDGYFSLECDILKTSPGSTDQVDFETNYKSDSNKSTIIPSKQIGYKNSFINYLDYTITSVDTLSWVELISFLPNTIELFEIYDSSAQVMELGVGLAGFETRLIVVFPNSSKLMPIHLPMGARISIRAISATATTGINVINFLG